MDSSHLLEARAALQAAQKASETRTLSVSKGQFLHGQARLYIDLELAEQTRIGNLLTLAGLQSEGSDAAARQAAALLHLPAGDSTGTAAAV